MGVACILTAKIDSNLDLLTCCLNHKHCLIDEVIEKCYFFMSVQFTAIVFPPTLQESSL
jgi:hypothetical protein